MARVEERTLAPEVTEQRYKFLLYSPSLVRVAALALGPSLCKEAGTRLYPRFAT